jgi:site-specific DNA-cytosine methylase
VEDSSRTQSKLPKDISLQPLSVPAQDITATAAQGEMDQTILFPIMPMNSGKDYKAFAAEKSQPIMAAGQTHGNQGGDVIVTPSVSQRTSAESSEPAESLPNSAPAAENPEADTQQLSVRRLTPTECETLQSFPKGWTVPDTEHWETRSRRTSRNG